MLQLSVQTTKYCETHYSAKPATNLHRFPCGPRSSDSSGVILRSLATSRHHIDKSRVRYWRLMQSRLAAFEKSRRHVAQPIPYYRFKPEG